MTTENNNTGRKMPLPWLTQLVNMQEQEELQQEEDQHESICLHCMLLEMREANENLACEVYELKGAVEKLLKLVNH